MSLVGVIPVLSMPFLPDGEVDFVSLRREVDWALSAGVHGLGLGLASEMPRLTESERSLVTQAVVDQADGRVPVVVQINAASTTAGIDLVRRAEADGAAALLVRAPTFELAPAAGHVKYFDALARATPLPILLQDLPGARIEISVVKALDREFPGRFGLKAETPPTHLATAEAVELTEGRVPVFGGAGGLLFYSELLRGSTGVMPGCVVPELFVEVWNRFSADDLDGARATFGSILPFLVATSSPEQMLWLYREALVRRGVFSHNAAREPAVRLSPLDRAELDQHLGDLGIETVVGRTS